MSRDKSEQAQEQYKSQDEDLESENDDSPENEGSGLPPNSGDAGSGSSSTGDLDGLLDEIDTVLESNAEELVSNYVQKGGQ